MFVSELENNPGTAYQMKDCCNLFLMQVFSECTENHCLPLIRVLIMRALTCEPKGHRFDSQSRACTWVAGSLPGPGEGASRRQPIDVSLSYLATSPSFQPLSMGKITSGEN